MIHIFTGDNSYEIKKSVDLLINKFVQEHGDIAIERFDSEESELAKILDAANSMPFFSGQKLVLVSNAGNKDLLELVVDLEAPDSTTLVLVAPKLDKRAGYYKKLAKLPGFKSYDSKQNVNLPAWVADTVKSLGGTISSGDARYLFERVGANQMLLSNEVYKLVSYDKNVSKENIDLLCDPTPQTTVFQLMDATFGGDVVRAQKIYQEQRARKNEPHAILGMIAWQLHILALVKTAGDRSVDDVAREAKINPFVVRKSQSIARKLSLPQLRDLVESAKHLDKLLKTKPIDADEAMQVFLLKLAV